MSEHAPTLFEHVPESLVASAPYQKHSGTSRDGAVKAAPSKDRQGRAVLELLAGGALTDNEILRFFGSPAFRRARVGLWHKGLVQYRRTQWPCPNTKCKSVVERWAYCSTCTETRDDKYSKIANTLWYITSMGKSELE